MKTAIVLSGGGAKGAYQIGFWKAIRRLGIKYDIVTGTSIGALNGAFMVQKDYHNAFLLWNFMHYNQVLNQDFKGSIFDSKQRKQIVLNYIKGAAKGGLEVPGLENIIDKYLNKDLFYNSNIDYGLVTVKFPSLKPVMLTKKEIEPEKLKDYLIASASCFPAFKMKEINNELYIDGGYYDNMPVELAIKLGADNIICVDLRAIGFKRDSKKYNVPIMTISSKNSIGNFLVLEKKQARRAIKLGYNDTMKAFNKLDGDFYTFRLGSLNRNYSRLYDIFISNLEKYIDIDNKSIKYKKFYGRQKEEYFNKILENVMKAFNIEEQQIYRTSHVNVLLKKIIKDELNNSLNSVKKIIKEEKLGKKLIDKKLICYIFKEMQANKKKSKTLLNLSVLFPDSFLCAVYLKTIIL